MPSSSSDLPIETRLTESDLRRFAVWNATGQAYSRGVLVPQLVAAQAEIDPHRVAVVARNEVFTYLQLEERANHIAHYLQSLGVGRNSVVGICLGRSMNLVAGALGVLKAGGAYFPLDPAYPPDRIAFLLTDAQAPVLLTEQHVAKRLPRGKWQLVRLDIDEPQISLHSSESPESGVSEEDLAYVIYTSGSTGRPKGVQITHGSLLNLVFWHQRAFDVKPSDRASQLASPAFDAAVWELWPYLTAGASIYIADDTVRNEPEFLRNWLVREGITIAFAPTPLAERIMALKWPPKTALRTLLTGADTLHTYPSPHLPFKLINNYGPTECAVVASSGQVLPDRRSDVRPSIGRPIANTQIYILDEQMQRVPVGVAGELCIAGAGLARGYLNHPELTAEKFVSNPFSSAPQARLYKTGDLARYLPDGQIAFLGRIDDQIKIQGYRIEPNEIVTALAKHPMLEAAAVIGREDTPGDKQLVAYVVPRSGSSPTDKLLREFLSGQLPEYMVPGVFVRMDSLPLNANGKIDCTALPKPDESNSSREGIYVAPRTPIEQRIAEMLGPLLGLKKVSIEDNFFMLGGHSLLGTQLIARTREAFGVKLSLRSLFESPTIAALAAEVERLLYVRLETMSEEEAEQFLKCDTGQQGRSLSGSPQS